MQKLTSSGVDGAIRWNAFLSNPERDGNGLCFIHLDKTGGSWCWRAMNTVLGTENLDRAILTRADIEGDKRLSAAIIRDPYQWYCSAHAFYVLKRRHSWTLKLRWDFGLDALTEDLNEFVAAVTQAQPGYLTQIYREVQFADMIGTTERLHDSLIRFLQAAGHRFDPQSIYRVPPHNLSGTLPQYRRAHQLSRNSRRLIRESERWAIQFWEKTSQQTALISS